MKKIILILCVMMVATVAGCGPNSDVIETIEAIDAIGQVNASSGSAIELAEEKFNALSERNKEKVENAASLVDAREKFEPLNQFAMVGESLQDGFYMELSSDKMSITIDTNPNDREDYFDMAALDLIQELHKELGIPDGVYTAMMQTRSIDGRPTRTQGNINISWSYHPDKGLDVLYEISP